MTPTRRQFVAAATAATATGLTGPAFAAGPKPEPQSPLFKLGMVTYNVAAQWDLPTILKVCKAVGIAAVECRTTHKHGVEPTLSAEQRDAVKKQFADSGVAFWGCGSVCEFQSPDPAVVKKNIETCRQFVQLVHDIGGTMVKVRPNGLPKGVPVEKTLEQIGKALVECGKAAEDYGVEICVEVHGAGTQEPANMKAIMEHCGHKKVGLTWNSNATDMKDGSVKASFDLLKPWIRSCHINEIYKDASGAYPYRELFRLFREVGYDRYTLIEVGRTPPDVASGEDLLRYYRALWLELVKG
jgi:sugar phosphate isomerase/epimerase